MKWVACYYAASSITNAIYQLTACPLTGHPVIACSHVAGLAVTSATIVIHGAAVMDPVQLLGRMQQPAAICLSLFGECGRPSCIAECLCAQYTHGLCSEIAALTALHLTSSEYFGGSCWGQHLHHHIVVAFSAVLTTIFIVTSSA